MYTSQSPIFKIMVQIPKLQMWAYAAQKRPRQKNASREDTQESGRLFDQGVFSRHLILTFKMDRIFLPWEHLLCYVLCLSEREVDKKARVYIKN